MRDEPRTHEHQGALGALVVVIVGVAVVFFCQFFLESLASSNLTWHGIQHVVIFLGGLAVGGGAARLYQAGQPQADLHPSLAGSIVVLAIGVGVAAFGQLYLDSFIDASLTWHWLQHGTLFIGGLAAGEAAYGLYLRELRRRWPAR
jgi:multisubunit Na+/H+ antiporter MnhB subunit